jgi:pyridoxine kinase
MNVQKRAAAIHDISCFGRCSLTVALPIISAAGIETAVIPTAVLSTHTGGIKGFTYRDLTEDIEKIVDHWKSLGLTFDSVYTGFLGSFEQIDIVIGTIGKLRSEGTIVVVDPVMADNGKLYEIFPKNFPSGMKRLCENADVIVPNITEAVLMLGEDFKEGPYERTYIESLLRKLGKLAEKVVLTGVFFNDTELGAAAYDRSSDSISYSFESRIPGYYHGTGDVFGSALTASLMNGIPLSEAAEIAVKFTAESIKRTFDAKTDIRFGVNFEAGLGELNELIRKKK